MGLATGRRVVAALVALGVAAVVAVVTYRVLAPAEVSTVARGDYPPLSVPDPGVVGRLPVAPLIVDGRLRVYSGSRQVYADQPVDGRYRSTPYWSYRRWPASLDAVVVSGTTVVSRWSDGRLVALDARTGRVAWRADGPRPDRARTARRTGAALVWDPSGLTVTRVAGGRDVVVSSGAGEVRAVDLAGGRELWRAAIGSGCRAPIGTGGGQLLTVDGCTGPPVIEFRAVATGEVSARWQPPDHSGELTATLVGCVPGGAGCAGLRTAGSADMAARGWLLGTGDPARAPALDGPGVALVDRTAVAVADGVLIGRSASDGTERWRAAVGPARVIAVQPGRVHVLTEQNELVNLDPATGVELSRFVLDIGSDGTGWAPGSAYAADGYVVVERLRRPVDQDADDQRYYLTAEALILAATGPMGE
ncbi:PQQ-binding-like beta-propeller repeat protein [Micromonospora sp. Llam7]|uniref:outer membrane protein assembly factor BamB family protein n=1 Tax=Micromonospora tarapacensis TaxID=2835305 RepID=UPI001C83BB75|nr:PQQ-binding-like beta-propeller repeat protein [Micromonospora tarapacensis]MBX7264883.1 PQQ-binding-like beta-propeller repeat protein [Micromonospora tarapacensis]